MRMTRLSRGTFRMRFWRRPGATLAMLVVLCLTLAACDSGSPPRPSTPVPSAASPTALVAASPSPARATAAPASPTAAPASPLPVVVPNASPAAPAPKPASSNVVVPGQAGPDLSQLSGTIKIVSSLPRTGASKPQTDAVVNGIRMALDEIGSKIGGATLQYQDLDDANPDRNTWDAAKEADNANQAAGDGDVMVYIGPFNSGAARVSIPILDKADLVMISPSATYDGLTRPGHGQPGEPDVYYPAGKRNFARVVPTDSVQGAVAAGWAQRLGAQKVYVLDDGDNYGTAVATVFTDTARKIGLNVVAGPDAIDPRAPDYSELASKIRDANPDLVYFGGLTDNNGGRLIHDLRSGLPDNVKIMGPDGLYTQAFLDDAGDAANGAYITFGTIAPSKLTGRGAEWYRSYKVRYNVEPAVYAPYAYEATKVAIDAIKRAGKKDRGAIREAVFATRDFEGILGRWSFDDVGDTTLTTMSGRQIKDGRFDDANAETLQAP
jgi:branched-chain amino acid transport system substrate-binding protein